MTADDKSILKSILEHISGMDYIKPEDLPNIDLYMDQVTTFMEDQLASTKRHDDDKILTKTMINNYAKNNLLPSPEKKRYSKDHLLMLIFIYYFKNILAITYTNKAAQEMRERVDKLVGFGSESIWVSTFHSACVRILRRHIDNLGYDTNFTIYDTDDQKSLMKDVCRKMNIDTKIYKERSLLAQILSEPKPTSLSTRSLIRAEAPTNCGAHPAESFFQTCVSEKRRT